MCVRWDGIVEWGVFRQVDCTAECGDSAAQYCKEDGVDEIGTGGGFLNRRFSPQMKTTTYNTGFYLTLFKNMVII